MFSQSSLNNLRKHLKSLPLPFRFAESSLQFLLSDDPLAPARFAPGRLVEKLTISFEGFHFSFLSKNHKRFGLKEKSTTGSKKAAVLVKERRGRFRGRGLEWPLISK